MFKFSLSFLLFAKYFFLSYLSTLSWSNFVFSILLKIFHQKMIFFNFFRRKSIFFRLFMLFAELKIIFVTEIFSFWAFYFEILVLSSLIFLSAAKAFLPQTELVNISTLIWSFKSFSFTCWNSLSTWSLIFFLVSFIFYFIVE